MYPVGAIAARLKRGLRGNLRRYRRLRTDRGVGLADEEFPREDELESRQDAALYPVGRALRRTFDAENHDSLGTDLTGLMLELARIDPDAEAKAGLPAPATSVAPTPEAPVVQVSGWRAAWARFLGR